MTEQAILEAVQEIFRDNFDDDTLEITRATCADDIEDWDSLEQINLLTAIEKKFNITWLPAWWVKMNHYTLAEMTPGLSESFTVTVTEEMMARFEAITGDVSPIHMDAEYAQKRGYPGRVVYGMLGASFFSTLAGVYLPGEHCLLHGVECKFAKPVFIGDTLTITGTVVNVSEAVAEAEIKAVITNQDGKRVTRGIIKAGLAK